MKPLKSAIFKYKKREDDTILSLSDAQQHLKEILKNFDEFCLRNEIKYSLAYGSLIGAAREKDIIPWDDDIDVMMTRDNFNKLLESMHDINKVNLRAYHYSNIKHTYTNEIRIYKDGFYRVLSNSNHKYLTPLCVDIFVIDEIPASLDKQVCSKVKRILSSIQRDKSRLILKEAKYDSKSMFRAMLRNVKKAIHIFPTSNCLHKRVDKNITKLSQIEGDKKLFSPFAHDDFDLCFDEKFFEKYTQLSFGNMKVSAISNYDEFLKSVYGNWRKPVDRSNGATSQVIFIKRAN